MDDDNVPSAVMNATIKQLNLECDEVMQKRLERQENDEFLVILKRMESDPFAMAEQYCKLLRILAAAYQVAGCHNAPDFVLDVLAYPEQATDDDVTLMLPYSPSPA